MKCLKRIFLLSGLLTFSNCCFGGDPPRPGKAEQARRDCKQFCNKPEFQNKSCWLKNICRTECDSVSSNWKTEIFVKIPFNNFQPFIIKNQKTFYDSCISRGSHAIGAKLNKAYCNRTIEEVQSNKNLNNGKELKCPNNDCNEYCGTDIQGFFNTEEWFRNFSWSRLNPCHSVALYHLLKDYGNINKDNSYYNQCFTHIKTNLIQQIIREADASANLPVEQARNHFRWSEGKGCDLNQQPCETEVKRAIANARNTCTNLHLNMARCCHNPESCAGGALGSALKLAATMKNIKGGVSERCQLFKDQMLANRGATGTVVSQCMWKVNQCQKGCNTEIAKVKQVLKEHCNFDGEEEFESHKHTCTRKFFNKYVTNEYQAKSCDISLLTQNGKTRPDKVRLADIPAQCSDSGATFQRSMQDLQSSLQEMIITAEVCRKQASGDDQQMTPPPVSQPGPERATPPSPSKFNNNGNIAVDIGGGGSKESSDKVDSGLPYSQKTRDPADPFANIEMPGEEEENTDWKKGGTPKSSDLMTGGGSGAGGFPFGNSGSDSNEPSYKGDREVATEDSSQGLIEGFGGTRGFGGYGSSEGYDREWHVPGQKRSSREEVTNSAEIDLEEVYNKFKSQRKNHRDRIGRPEDNIFEMIHKRYVWMCVRRRLICPAGFVDTKLEEAREKYRREKNKDPPFMTSHK